MAARANVLDLDKVTIVVDGDPVANIDCSQTLSKDKLQRKGGATEQDQREAKQAAKEHGNDVRAEATKAMDKYNKSKFTVVGGPTEAATFSKLFAEAYSNQLHQAGVSPHLKRAGSEGEATLYLKTADGSDTSAVAARSAQAKRAKDKAAPGEAYAIDLLVSGSFVTVQLASIALSIAGPAQWLHTCNAFMLPCGPLAWKPWRDFLQSGPAQEFLKDKATEEEKELVHKLLAWHIVHSRAVEDIPGDHMPQYRSKLSDQASTSRIVSASAFRALLVHYGIELQQKHADSVNRAAASGDEPQSADLAGIAALDLAKGLNILQASANEPKTHPCKKAHGDLSKHLVDLAEKDGCEAAMTHLVQLVLKDKSLPAEKALISGYVVMDANGSAALSLPAMERGTTPVTMSTAVKWQSIPSDTLLCSHKQTKLGYQLCAAAMAEPQCKILVPGAVEHLEKELASQGLKWITERSGLATQSLLSLQGDCVARFLDTVASDIENQAPPATTPSVAVVASAAVPPHNAAVPVLSSALRALGSVSNVASHTVSGTLDGACDAAPVGFAPASTPLGLDPSAIATTGGQVAMLGVLSEVRDLLRILCRSLEGQMPLAAPTATQQPDVGSPTAQDLAAEAAEALQRMRASRQQRAAPPAAIQVVANAAAGDATRVQQDAAPEPGVDAAASEGERVQQDVPSETDMVADGPISGTGQQPIRQTVPEPPHGKRARHAAAGDEADRDEDGANRRRQGDGANDAITRTKGTKGSNRGRPAKTARSAPAAPAHTPRTSGRKTKATYKG